MRGVRLLILSLAAAWVCAARGQPVQGAVEAVGFAAGRSGGCIRAGQWFPVRVQFAVQGTGLYTRELQVQGIDLDGDRVVYGQPQVTLSSEGGEKKKRVWCYTVANAGNELPAEVDVLDERGESVDKLPFPPPPCETMSNDDLLILDLSAQEIVALNLLATPNWTPGRTRRARFTATWRCRSWRRPTCWTVGWGWRRSTWSCGTSPARRTCSGRRRSTP